MAEDQQGNPEADLLRLAGSVHTYESFGRAVVAAALAQAAKSAKFDEPMTASVRLRPVSHAVATFGAGDDAAGGVAKGHVPPTCYQLEVYEGGPSITVCY